RLVSIKVDVWLRAHYAAPSQARLRRAVRREQRSTRPRLGGTAAREDSFGMKRGNEWAIGLFLLLGLALGCSRSKVDAGAGGSEFETLVLRYQGNNGTVSPAELAEELGYLAPLKLEFV